MFNQIASFYELTNHLMSGWLDVLWRDRMAEHFEGVCLDLAGGTGEISKRISCSPRVTTVVCADISEGMLKYATSKKYCFAPHFVLCDAHKLPFRNETFDTVGVAFGIRNFQSRDTAVEEIKRVLKEGGKLVVLETFRPDKVKRYFKPFYLVWLKVIIPQVAGVLTGDKNSYLYMVRSILNFWSVDEFCEFLEKAGFEVKKVEGMTFDTVHVVVAQKL